MTCSTSQFNQRDSPTSAQRPTTLGDAAAVAQKVLAADGDLYHALHKTVPPPVLWTTHPNCEHITLW